MSLKCSSHSEFIIAGLLALMAGVTPRVAIGQTDKNRIPAHLPPKRSSQIQNGFGINSDLPRDPYLPWNRWWWTRMFDAGVSWIRIGQYENSSEPTSWDWVEQKRGVYTVSPEVDDYVDSLVDNGVKVQVQLLYGNPMYTSPAGRRPMPSLLSPVRFTTTIGACIQFSGRPRLPSRSTPSPST